MTPPSTPPAQIDQDTVRAVVGRVDRLEADLAKLNRTVTGLGSAVKGLLAQKQEQAVQPDWLTVDKPAVAQAMLLATVDWTERYGATLGLKVQPCWPWHPQLVAVLLAAAQHHYAVYHGPSPDRGHRLPHPLPARHRQAAARGAGQLPRGHPPRRRREVRRPPRPAPRPGPLVGHRPRRPRPRPHPGPRRRRLRGGTDVRRQAAASAARAVVSSWLRPAPTNAAKTPAVTACS